MFLFRPEEVQHIVSGKLALKYQGSEIEAMKEVAQASKNRSLAEFQSVSISSLLIQITVPRIFRKFKKTRLIGSLKKIESNYFSSRFEQAVKKYAKQLEQDRIVAKHLDTLYQTMLEQNLCRIIEPYSRVQVI